MLYQKKVFSVPASAGTEATCAEQGHAMPDAKGKCIRCGENIRAQRHSKIIADAFMAKARNGR